VKKRSTLLALLWDIIASGAMLLGKAMNKKVVKLVLTGTHVLTAAYVNGTQWNSTYEKTWHHAR
jgi:hypothetical protein